MLKLSKISKLALGVAFTLASGSLLVACGSDNEDTQPAVIAGNPNPQVYDQNYQQRYQNNQQGSYYSFPTNPYLNQVYYVPYRVYYNNVWYNQIPFTWNGNRWVCPQWFSNNYFYGEAGEYFYIRLF